MRYTLSAVLAAILFAAVPAYPHERDGLRGEVTVEFVSDSGAAMLSIPHKDFWKDGTRIIKNYLEAKKGEKYSIVIRNMTPGRIGVVVAVDGRNIISGRKSDLKTAEDMYIVGAYESGRYEGWRTDQDTVHRFYFTVPSDSYSARTFNDTSAMGVIAVAVYRERVQQAMIEEKLKLESAPAAPSMDSTGKRASIVPRDEAAGSGFGEEQHSPTIRVAFDPEPRPVQKTLVKYEWRETLCRKGVLRCGQEGRNRLWDEAEYAPFPPGYRGN